MAATVSAWAKPGAWALDSEEHEHELLQQHKEESAANGNRFSGSDAGETAAISDFPSLAAAASTKAKKKKPQTFSLGEFSAYPTSQARGLITGDLTMLPTGPRERSAEELDRSRLGGGFRSYGSNDRNNDSSNSRWGSSRDSDENRRGGGFGRESNRELAPSRADEIDDWGAAKKSTIGGGFESRERGGFFSDSHSRADESDSWVSNKCFVPSEGRKYGSNGGGFDSLKDRLGGFESNGSGRADSENWGKKKEEEGRRFGANGGAFDSLRERRGGNELNGGNGAADSDTWGKKREDGIGSGRPRLNLQPRKLPVGENGTQPRKLPVGENGTVTVKPSKGWNPFGDARPREEVLKEKGQDWKEIDEKLESMKIKDDVSSDRLSFGKRSFGSGNERMGMTEDRSERGWRKSDSVDVRPPSDENSENGISEVGEDGIPQM